MEVGNISAAIKQIIELEGDSIFLDPKRFCAILDDLAIGARKESKIIRRGVNETVLRLFYEVYKGDNKDRRTQLRRVECYLEDELGLAAEWRSCIIEAFSVALGCNDIVTAKTYDDETSTTTLAEGPLSVNNSYEADILSGFRDYEEGKVVSARNRYCQILLQDDTCAVAYLGMLLVCKENERAAYGQKFLQYAPKQISPIEKKIITSKTRKAILQVYLDVQDVDRIYAVLDVYGRVTYDLFCEAVIQFPSAQLVRAFLAHGFDMNYSKHVQYSDGTGEAPIISQLMEQHVKPEVIEALLDAGFDPNAERIFYTNTGFANRFSLLGDSIWRAKNVHYADILLRYGANVHFVNKTNHPDNVYAEKTMLHEAVLDNNIDMVRLLLKYGADANSCRLRRTQYGDEYYSVLSDSVWNLKNVALAELLIDYGADVHFENKRSYENGSYEEKSLISEAVLSNNIGIIRLLLQHGANPNAIRLYRCASYDEHLSILGDSIWNIKNIDIMRLLLNHGGDATRCEEKHLPDGRVEKTCLLHYAVAYAQSEEMVRLLLEHGASIEDPVPCKERSIPFKRYPYKCGYPLIATLEKIGWRGSRFFGLF